MAPPLVGINPGQNPIINNPNPEVQNPPLQNPPVQNPPGQNPPGQNPVQNPPVQNPPPENNPADGFENIDVPLLQEALDKPATTAERILRDPLGVSEKVSEQIAAQPKKFTVWQIIVSVLTFGMAAVYYRDTGFFNSLGQNHQGENLRDDMAQFQESLKNFVAAGKDGQPHQQNIRLQGATVILSSDEQKRLTAKIKDPATGNTKTLRLPLNAEQLLQQVKTDIVTHPKIYGREVCASAIGIGQTDRYQAGGHVDQKLVGKYKEDFTAEGNEDKTPLELKRRTLIVQFIEKMTGQSNADFSMMDTRQLRDLADRLNAVMDETPEKVREVYNNFITEFNNGLDDAHKKPLLNSVLVSDLLAKLDKKEGAGDVANVEGLKKQEQRKIESERRDLRKKIDDIDKQVGFSQTKIKQVQAKSAELATRVETIRSLNALSQELLSLEAEQGKPGAAMMAILSKHADALEAVARDRSYMNDLPDIVHAKLYQILDFCEHRAAGVPLMREGQNGAQEKVPLTPEQSRQAREKLSAQWFRENFPAEQPPEKTELNLLFFSKEVDNPAFARHAEMTTFLGRMEPDFTGVPQEGDGSAPPAGGFRPHPMRTGLQFARKIEASLNSLETVTPSDITRELAANRDLLLVLKGAPEGLGSLRPELRAIVEQLFAANPDLTEPLVPEPLAEGPLKSAVMDLMDIYDAMRIGAQLRELEPNEQNPQAVRDQYFDILERNAEALFRIADRRIVPEFIKKLPDSKAVSSVSPLLNTINRIIMPPRSYSVAEEHLPAGTLDDFKAAIALARAGGLPASFEDYYHGPYDPDKDEAEYVTANYDPNADEAAMTQQEKEAHLAAKPLYEQQKAEYEQMKAEYLHQQKLFRTALFLKPDDLVRRNEQERFVDQIGQKMASGTLTLDAFKEIVRSNEKGFALFLSHLNDFVNGSAGTVFKNYFLSALSGFIQSIAGPALDSEEGIHFFIQNLLADQPDEHMPPLMRQRLDQGISEVLQVKYLMPSETVSLVNEMVRGDSLAMLGKERLSNEMYDLVRTLKEEQKNSIDSQNQIDSIRKQSEAYEQALKQREVHGLIADLILNQDGDTYDKSLTDANLKPGTRIVQTLLAHPQAFSRLISDPKALESLPEQMRGPMRQAIGQLRGRLLLSQYEQGMAGEPKSDIFQNIPAFDPNAAPAKTEAQHINEQALARIIDQHLMPLEFFEDFLASVTASGGLAQADADRLLEKARQDLAGVAVQHAGMLADAKSNPFTLAFPGEDMRIAAQGAVLANQFQQMLGDPGKAEHEPLWNAVASVEAAVSGAVTEASNQIAQMVSGKFDAMFAGGNNGPAPAALDPTDPDVTLKQLMDESNANFKDTALGKFILEGMKKYFANMSEIDKRAMLSSMLRYSTSDSTPGQVLGAMFKGAGPILQKLLQRIPASALDADFKQAVKDMKCNLAPISERVVQAHLLEMVENSAGAITKIDVVGSLGAASVGQAILCKFYTRDHPEGIDKVVKILRPDVQNRVQRECEIFREAAKTVPGMDVTFENDLKTILEELDLTNEAAHVRSGQIYSKGHPSVKSMTLSTLVDPTSDTMVLDLAPGTTLDHAITEADGTVQDLIKPWLGHTQPDGTFIRLLDFTGEAIAHANDVPLEKALENYNKLCELEHKLIAKQKMLSDFTKQWVKEGIFGSGFYHADLHAGNMMVSDDQLTVIDFGNSMQLTEQQQSNVIKMMAAALFSDPAAFIDGLENLLSPASKERLDGHVNKDDPASPLVRDELRRVITAVLGKGTGQEDSGQRILVSLQEVMKLGIEMPAPIYSFSKCYMALSNAIDDLNEQVRQTYNAMRTMAFNVAGDEHDPVVHLMKVFAEGSDSQGEAAIRKDYEKMFVDAHKLAHGEEYAAWLNQMVRKNDSDLNENQKSSIMPYLAKSPEAKAAWDSCREIQALIVQQQKLQDAARQIEDPDQRAQMMVEIEGALGNLEGELRRKSAELVEHMRTAVDAQIDALRVNVESAVKIQSSEPDTFVSCMSDVLKEKRSQALDVLGTGKMIKYGVPLIAGEVKDFFTNIFA